MKMRRLVVFSISALIAFVTNVSADPHSNEVKCGDLSNPWDAKALLSNTYNAPRGGDFAPLVFTAAASQSPRKPDPIDMALAKTTITVTLKPAGFATGQLEPWRYATTLGAAETERKIQPEDKIAAKQAAIMAQVVERSADKLVLTMLVPDNPTWSWRETWRMVAAVCDGRTNALLGYGMVTVKVTARWFALTTCLIAVAIFWIFITLAAWQLNSTKLETAWTNHKADNPGTSFSSQQERFWKAKSAANPLFISQDSLGYGSLSRFQILVFTSVVGFVLLYIFVHSSTLTPVSETILMLLGITLTGGTLARAASSWTDISSESRRLLLGKQLLKVRTDEKPRFSDLLETQGEVDVSKVQALLFTGLVATSIVVNGVILGLEAFDLPKEIVALTLVSQVAYVGAKLIPVDTRKRVEQDLDGLRKAAAAVRINSDETSLNAFEQAKRAAASTLHETFLKRFDAATFMQLKPTEV